MSRTTGSKNKIRPPEIIRADEIDRLKYLATLLLEITEDELRKEKAAICNPN